MIRDATFEDFDELLELFRKAHGESIFADLPFNEAKVQRTFVTTLAFDRGYARVIERSNKILGCLAGTVVENQFGVVCAQDLLNYSHAGTDKLVKDFMGWAQKHGAIFVQITDFSEGDRYGKLLSSIGLKPAGVNYLEVV